MNQITEGQLAWQPVGDVIDKVELGVGDNRTTHLVCKGREEFRAELKKKFLDPEDHVSIDKFFDVMKVCIFRHEKVSSSHLGLIFSLFLRFVLSIS